MFFHIAFLSVCISVCFIFSMSTVPCLAVFALYAQRVFMCVNVYKMMVVVMMISVCTVSHMEQRFDLMWQGHLIYLCVLLSFHHSLWLKQNPTYFHAPICSHTALSSLSLTRWYTAFFCSSASVLLSKLPWNSSGVWNIDNVSLFLDCQTCMVEHILVLNWVLLNSTDGQGSTTSQWDPFFLSFFLPFFLSCWVRPMCV